MSNPSPQRRIDQIRAEAAKRKRQRERQRNVAAVIDILAGLFMSVIMSLLLATLLAFAFMILMGNIHAFAESVAPIGLDTAVSVTLPVTVLIVSLAGVIKGIFSASE